MSAEVTKADLAGSYLSEPYDVKLGVDGSHWFVGVKPPISKEIFAKLGGNIMRGWEVEETEAATLFSKVINASKEASRNDAEQLVQGLMSAGAECVRLDMFVAKMQGLDSPFEDVSA